MKPDIDGNLWYVHSCGVHEGGFKDVDSAITFAQKLLNGGREEVQVESRKNWLSWAVGKGGKYD